MSFSDKFKEFLYLKFPKHVKVPILGAPGCGKSTFLAALGQYVGYKRLGLIHLKGDKDSSKFLESISLDANNPTTGLTEYMVILQKSPKTRQVCRNIIFDTGDISGHDFLNRSENYYEYVKNAGGVIILLDLVPDLNFTEFEKARMRKVEILRSIVLGNYKEAETLLSNVINHILKQIQPTLITLRQISETRKMKNKTISLIVSKEDLHVIPNGLKKPLLNIIGDQIRIHLSDSSVKVFGPYIIDARKVIANPNLNDDDQTFKAIHSVIQEIAESLN